MCRSGSGCQGLGQAVRVWVRLSMSGSGCQGLGQAVKVWVRLSRVTRVMVVMIKVKSRDIKGRGPLSAQPQLLRLNLSRFRLMSRSLLPEICPPCDQPQWLRFTLSRLKLMTRSFLPEICPRLTSSGGCA